MLQHEDTPTRVTLPKTTSTTKSTKTSQTIRTTQETGNHPSSSCGSLSCGVTLLSFAPESLLHNRLARSRAHPLQTFEQAVKLYFEENLIELVTQETCPMVTCEWVIATSEPPRSTEASDWLGSEGSCDAPIQSYTNHARKRVRSRSGTHGKISQHNSKT